VTVRTLARLAQQRDEFWALIIMVLNKGQRISWQKCDYWTRKKDLLYGINFTIALVKCQKTSSPH